MSYFFKIFSFCFLFLLGVCSCSSYKKVPYLQSGGVDGFYPTRVDSGVIRFLPDDILSITVNVTGEPLVAQVFNLPLYPTSTPENSSDSSLGQGYGRQSYQVNSRGEIDFPVLGLIRVEGLSIEELESSLKVRLKSYLKVDPILTIRLTNFRISVLGEVSRPGSYGISKRRVNVLEALALAGDMSIHGRRDNIRLMRQVSTGDFRIVYLDLTDPLIAGSPYFYLHQNDVLYVEPNKARSRSSDIGSQTGTLISLGSMALTLVNLIVLIAK